MLGGGSDIAALGVEDHGDLGMALADMSDHSLELRFGTRRGEVGDLRLERAGVGCGGVDNGTAEIGDGRLASAQGGRKAVRIGIQADA